MKITQEQKEILEAGTFEWNIYKLPDIQLDRKMYKLINDILNTLWGKWKTRVWHIFQGEQEDLENALKEVLEKWETETLAEIKKRFQFYPTPEIVAKKLVELAEINENDNVLEPSAGQGAISDEILKTKYNKIVLFELDIKNITILKDKYNVNSGLIDVADNRGTYSEEYKMNIYQGDFLDNSLNKEHFNKIIMNPPFSKNQDVKHILEAYSLLNDWWRIVAIAPSNLLDKTTKLHQKLKELDIEKIELPEWSFKEAWTTTWTCILIINK